MTEPLLGRSIDRLEDERFVRGRGRYIADLVAPNALHGVVVRSPHCACARIAAISVDTARQMPGVAAVLTGQELAADNIGPLAVRGDQYSDDHAARGAARHALARDVRSLCGEPVVFVIADSTEAARDAAEAVIVDYAPLPPVVSIADAVLPDAPSIWPEAQGNIAFQFNRGEIGPVEAAIRDAAHVVECELVNNHVVAAPMETRGRWRVRCFDGRLHLTASAAGAHAIRDLLADGVFRIGREKLHVSIPDVGGGFGMKNVLYPEWVLVLWAAPRLARSHGSAIAARISPAPPMAATASSGPPGARPGRPLPRARHQSPRQSGRPCLDGGAGRADHGDGERDGRRLRHSR